MNHFSNCSKHENTCSKLPVKTLKVISMSFFNPFLANVPILYPLKKTETLWLSGVFRGYKIRPLRNGLSRVCIVYLKLLTHSCHCFFCTPWKHQKTFCFLMSQGYRKKPVAWNRWIVYLASNKWTIFKNNLPCQTRGSPVNFAKFLRTPFFREHLRWLLLNSEICRMVKLDMNKSLLLGIKTLTL